MIGPLEPPHPPRRIHSLPDAMSLSPTSFSVLSTVAMDELYTLEREEALRRAEYEARHAEALRRVSQRENRKSVRGSKSAASSPLHPNITLRSGEREWKAGDAEDTKPTDKTKRRLSGPAWQMTPLSHEPSLGHPHTSGHVVESSSSAGLNSHSGRQHVHWGQPYQTPMQPPHSQQYRHLARQNDTPSPLSSDSDSLPPHNPTHSPSHLFSATQSHSMHTSGPPDSGTRPSEFAFTPSTSPFLAPLRTLNLHSANTSRAPSPILLPPPSILSNIAVDVSTSPTDESQYMFGSRSHGTSFVNSPPKPSVQSRSGVRKKGGADDRFLHLSSLPQTHFYSGQLPQLSEKAPLSSSSHTPQLSSGPSSDGSSPRSMTYPLGTSAPSTSAPFHFDLGRGTRSASNSRPESPTHWPHSSHHHSRDHSWGGSSNNHPHHHLAHSVRKAFDMTPIHPPPRNTSWPSSLSGQTLSGTSTPAYPNIFSSSVPASRSGSPPITLPPLKMTSPLSIPSRRSSQNAIGEHSIDDESGDLVGGTRRMHPNERLPGFSEFEAASRAPSNR